MSNSISSTVVKILADNSQYKKDMQEVESIRKNISSKVSAYDKIEARDIAKVNDLYNKRIAKQRELEEAVKSNAGIKSIEKLRKELARLATAEEKAITVAKKNSAKRAASFKAMNAEAKAARGSVLSLSTALKGLGIGSIATAGFALFTKSMNDLDAMGKRAADLKISATAMYELSHAAKLAGVSTDKLDVGLKTLAKTYGKDVKTAMVELSDRVSNGTLSVAEASKYFGENALEMMRILKQGKSAVSEMFNQNYLDEAALSAENFNNVLENLSHSVLPTIYNIAGSIGGAVDQIARGESSIEYRLRVSKELAEKRKAKEEAAIPILERMDKINKDIAESKKMQLIWTRAANESEKKANTELFKSELKREESSEATLKHKAAIIRDEYKNEIRKAKSIIKNADNEMLEAQVKLLGEKAETEYNIRRIVKDIGVKQRELEKYDKRSVAYANKYAEIKKDEINLLKLKAILKKNEEADIAKANAKYEANAKKRESEYEANAKKKESEKEALKDLKEQLLIESAIANAKTTKQAEEIKAANEILKIQRQYSISAKEALDIYKQQVGLKDKEANKMNKDSNKEGNKDPDKIKKAKDILERGKKGTVGKRTLDEAQAYLEGKTPEGGFKTSMFKDKSSSNKSKLFNTDKANDSYNRNKELFGYNKTQTLSAEESYNKNKKFIRSINGNTTTTAKDKKDEKQDKKNMLDTVITDTLPKLLAALQKIENATQITAENSK